jgi:hypothetical protein
MKDLLIALTVIGGFAQLAIMPSAFAQAADTAAPKGTPHAQFSETVHDFGKVKSSDALRYDFIVTNTGNALLEITDVKPGCGCTTAGAWDKQIEPGKTGKIPLQLNPANFSGLVTKPITVTCNDPAQGTHSLQLKAEIWKPIDVQPNYVHFMSVEEESTNETKVVRISNRTEEVMKLETPQSSNPAFKTELKTVQPGKEFELLVNYLGPISNSTPQGYITIKTSSTNMPMINVTTYAMSQPSVVISPLQLTLPATQIAAGYKQSAFLRNNGSTPLKVTEASVNAEGVNVQVTEPPGAAGRIFSITINYPADFHPPSGKPLELTVKTSHPKRSLLTVPIVVAATPQPAQIARPPALPGGVK